MEYASAFRLRLVSSVPPTVNNIGLTTPVDSAKAKRVVIRASVVTRADPGGIASLSRPFGPRGRRPDPQARQALLPLPILPSTRRPVP